MTYWERPAAGREPAAAALLGWLADPQAPRLCLVSGPEGCGKSTLLAWLVRHGSRAGTPTERAVHAVVPSAGQSIRGTVWALANQLGVVARAPGELVAVLAAEVRRTVVVLPDLHTPPVAELVLELVRVPHLRVLVEARTGSPAHSLLKESDAAELSLDLEQWTDQRRYEEWRAALPEERNPGLTGRAASASVDLFDPAAVCAADPWLVTAAYEAQPDEDCGGLRGAWLRAGQSLCREQTPVTRALVLLTALGDSAEPRLRPALTALAEEADWRVEWTRARGDLTPPWPGPVVALATGSGLFDDCLLVADHLGTVRLVSALDAVARGRTPAGALKSTAMSVLPDGTVLLLDQSGQTYAEKAWTTQPAGSGIAALLDDGPTEADQLIETLQQHTGTALTSAAGPETDRLVAALGDKLGAVRVFGAVTGTAALHSGQVTALAALSVPMDDGTQVPIVYSGGADGTVRAWAPGHEPMDTPITERECPVVALHAARTPQGSTLAVAWDDGLVELHLFDTGEHLHFRPGPPVRAVAVTAGGSIAIGMDEALVHLTIRRPTPASLPPQD